MTGLHEFWALLTSVDATKIKILASEHTGLALLVCFFSGILTSLTPCIYPMIPITINIFGRAATGDAARERSQGIFNLYTFRLAAVYVGGMCFTYSVLGLIAGMTGSLFGRVLQSPIFLGIMTLIFFTLALGQFGLFKVQLPPSIQTKLARGGNADSPFGIFLMGLFSGLIISPCVGPVIAGILAFVFDTSSAFVGFIYFLSFSLGLGVLFLVIGGFSGILGKLPRSGQWMIRVNRVLATLLLFASFYYGFVWGKQVGLIRNTAAQQSLLTWITNEKDALTEAEKRQLPIMVDFAADWCVACGEINSQIFGDPKVADYLKTHFVLLRLDVTNDTAENSAILNRYMVQSLPTIAFLTKDGVVTKEPRVTGLIPVDAFLAIVKRGETL